MLISADRLFYVVYGSVQFDQPAVIRDPEGNELTIDAVHDKVMISEGPVTNVCLVHHVGAPAGSKFFLVFKNCKLLVLGDELLVKKQIQNLESKLERLTHLASHPNIASPLAYRIERSEMTDATKDQGWNISTQSRSEM